MAQKTTSATIIDHVDGQPSIILANGNWGVFDPKTKEYKDTGVKATAIDDNSAVKYFKLNNTSTAPTAPNKAGGYANIKPELDNALVADGWSLDPLTPSKNNKFCWIAVYGMENLPDVEATQTNGAMTFKQKFTLRTVGLWANYAESSTITVEGDTITIKNPDGTITSQQFVTKEKADDLTTMVNALQAQVDGAIYSYSMEGVPTMDKAPVTDWRIDADLSDTALIADIYKTHVGDTYTDTLTYFSYRFTQIGASASNPAHYGWKIIENDALTAALGEIANLGNTKMTIFTVKPDHGKYKAGDMWLQSDNTMMVAIADGNNKNFNTAHWIQPFATKAEVSAVQSDLDSAKADAQATANNLNDLNDSLGSLTDGVGKAIKDNIVTAAELRDLQTFSDALDVEQAKMLSTVTYLLGSKFLPSKNNSAIVAVKARFLDTGGSIDQLQVAILEMDANNDGVISADERANYNTKLGIYKGHATEMENAVSDARKAIDLRLEAITDEKVDAIEIGGRNLARAVNSRNYSGISSMTSDGNALINQAAASAMVLIPTYYSKTTEGAHMVAFNAVTNQAERVIIQVYDEGKVEIKNKSIAGWSYNQYYNGYFMGIGKNDAKVFDAPIGTAFIRVSFIPMSVGTNNKLELISLTLTRGNKATDWTPAPEDVQAEIDGVSSSLTTLVGTTKSALEDGIIDKTERAKITELDRALDIEQERLISTVWALKENPNLDMIAEGLLNKASDDVLKAVTGSIDKLQAQLQVILAKTKVTEADKNSYTALYNTFKTTMKALEIAIINAQEAISKNSIDNIEIGGRNLLPSFSSGKWISLTGSDVTVVSPYEFIRTSPYVNHYSSTDVYVEGGNTFTFSGRIGGKLAIYEYNSEDARTRIVVAYQNIQKITFTTLPQTVRLNIILSVVDLPEGEYSFSNVKLEKGNKATDWTPAPEDVQANIETAKTEAEAAAKDYANTKAEAERVLAEAYADGIVSDEEQARIDDVNAKLAVAKEYAEAQDALLKTQQEAYADGAISTAEQAAIQAAKDYADLKKTEAEAYADGIVSDEEARAIADALKKFNDSKAHAEQLVNNIEIGGRNLIKDSSEEWVTVTTPTSSYINNFFPTTILESEQEYTFSWEAEIVSGTPSGTVHIGCGTTTYQRDILATGVPIIGKNKATFKPTSAHLEAHKSFAFMWRNDGAVFTFRYRKLKLEKGTKATDWSPAPEDIQAEIDLGVAIVTTLYRYADDGVTVNKPTATNEVSQGWTEASLPKVKGKVIWSVNRVTLKNGTKIYQNPANIQGAEGEDALSVQLHRQGSFRTWWQQVSDAGTILTKPKKVSEIVGGVTVAGVQYVEVKAVIYKGSRDVTSIAMKSLAQGGGGAFKWFIVGGPNPGQKASNVDRLLLSVDYADGLDDEVQFEYNDANAKMW